MEQQYILRNAKSFEPVHIFECGQCFRWNKEEDGSYTGVIKNSVVNVKKIGNNVEFTGVCDENIKKICEEYFNLQTNYEAIKEKLSNTDIYLKNSIKYGNGIRILKQDLWETLLSFIISANNNIPRIKTIIERIAKKYGDKIEYKNNIYYTFPTAEMLQNASIEDFRSLGLGFRDVRIYETVQKTLKGEIDLEELKQEENTERLRKELLEIPGVGPKVADCVMLFALNKFDVFPVDVWVKRVISELYFDKKEQTPNVIHEFAEKQYGDLAGLAQQYLFYWRRENSI